MATRRVAKASLGAGAVKRRADQVDVGGSESELFNAVLDAPADPLVILGAGRRVLAANRAFHAIESTVAISLIGKVLPLIARASKPGGIEVEGNFRKLGRRVYCISAGQLNGSGLVSLSF